LLKLVFRNPKLYVPPEGDDQPPGWIRTVLIGTCGGVSFAHGSNDGQKGMGLLLLVLIGFFPLHYALTVNEPWRAKDVYAGVLELRGDYQRAGIPMPRRSILEQEPQLGDHLDLIEKELKDKASFEELPRDKDTRWEVRQAITDVGRELKRVAADVSLPEEFRSAIAKRRKEQFMPAVEYVPLWVIVGTAIALGLGTMIGYKRIVKTVAEKIGKHHLTYAQGAAAETVAATTILVTAVTGLPVSTTHVLNSGVAGTMAANRSGLQWGTVIKILSAWLFTLPSCIVLAGSLFWIGRMISG
jgi:PiT family inorganic phosphate transporter